MSVQASRNRGSIDRGESGEWGGPLKSWFRALFNDQPEDCTAIRSSISFIQFPKIMIDLKGNPSMA